jgi:hypothetical protein
MVASPLSSAYYATVSSAGAPFFWARATSPAARRALLTLPLLPIPSSVFLILLHSARARPVVTFTPPQPASACLRGRHHPACSSRSALRSVRSAPVRSSLERTGHPLPVNPTQAALFLLRTHLQPARLAASTPIPLRPYPRSASSRPLPPYLAPLSALLGGGIRVSSGPGRLCSLHSGTSGPGAPRIPNPALCRSLTLLGLISIAAGASRPFARGLASVFACPFLSSSLPLLLPRVPRLRFIQPLHLSDVLLPLSYTVLLAPRAPFLDRCTRGSSKCTYALGVCALRLGPRQGRLTGAAASTSRPQLSPRLSLHFAAPSRQRQLASGLT